MLASSTRIEPVRPDTSKENVMTQTIAPQQQAVPVDLEVVQEHLERLATFPLELAELLKDQPSAALTFHPAADMWSINEILGHMIVFDARWGNRIRQILSADGVRFVIMDANDMVARAGFQAQQGDDLLAGFTSRRAERVRFLQGLNVEQLVRAGTHPNQGTLSVADAIAILVDSDTHRRSQIETNLQAYHATTRSAARM
jgi:uncharacterized damage-inducible protein DinB